MESYFTYDILEIDMLGFSWITTPLLKFTKEDVKDYYNDIFPFEWEPLTKVENGQTYLLGSPGITCSDFYQRRPEDYDDVLHVVSGVDKYKFASYYAGLYLNKHPEKTLATFDYSKVEDDLIVQIANFLKKCQEDQSVFNYKNVTCVDINWQTYPSSIAQTESQQTLGYSQNLYRFFADGVVENTPTEKQKSSIDVKHILGDSQRKIVYVDQFIAKQTDNDSNGRKKTILAFNKFMISDEVLQVYAKGLYLANRHQDQFTYLIPPTISYLNKLKSQDDLYRKVYSQLFERSTLHPIYQKEYADNFRGLSSLIITALKKYSNQLASRSKTGPTL